MNMKRILFGLIVVGAVMASCKKEHSKPAPPMQGGLQKVTFSAGFSVSTGYIQSTHHIITNSLGINSTPDTALTNHISELYYMVFDSAGNKVHYITQLSTDTAFGHYIDNLHPGIYTIAIGGSVNSNFLAIGSSLSGVGYTNGDWGGGEFFFGKTTFTVGNVPVSQSVQLERKSSKVVITIKDALPADTNATFKLAVPGVGTTFAINRENFGTNGEIYENYQVGSAAGTKNFQLTFIYYYAEPFNIEISCVNATRNIVYSQRTISTVQGGINKITNLSGNLFGGQGTGQSGGFQTSLDTTWQTPVVVPFH